MVLPGRVHILTDVHVASVVDAHIHNTHQKGKHGSQQSVVTADQPNVTRQLSSQRCHKGNFPSVKIWDSSNQE